MAIFTIRWAFRPKRALFTIFFPNSEQFRRNKKALEALALKSSNCCQCQFSQKVSFDDETDVPRKYLMSVSYLPSGDLLETLT